MTEDQQAYEAAVKLVEAKRCITCDNYQANASGASCAKYACPLPDDCLFTPQDCAGWMYKIPF